MKIITMPFVLSLVEAFPTKSGFDRLSASGNDPKLITSTKSGIIEVMDWVAIDGSSFQHR